MVPGGVVDFWVLIFWDGGWPFFAGGFGEMVFWWMVFCGEFVVFGW
jgi:hypothetical protein